MKSSTIRALKDCSLRTLTSITEKDFYGIASITSKDVAGTFKSQTKLPQKQILDKYQPLVNKRNQYECEEIESNVTFGRVRFDKDNVPRTHGQFDAINEKKLYETTQIKQLYMPIDVDNSEKETSELIKNDTNICAPLEESLTEINAEGFKKPFKIVEVKPDVKLGQVLELLDYNDTNFPERLDKYKNLPPLTFFFQKTIDKDVKEEFPANKHNKLQLHKELTNSNEDFDKLEQLEFQSKHYSENNEIPIQDLDPNSEEYYKRDAEIMKELEWNNSIDEEFDMNRKLDEPPKALNALDYLKAVRSHRVEPTAKGLKHRIKDNNPFGKRIDLDSKGFRVYTHQVIDWNKLRKVEILTHLKRAILFNNYGILALNKPYGIASHEEERKREPFDINNLMQELAVQMKYDKLHLVHRLDKTTTGVLLFATSKEKASQLNKLFKSSQITKTYWCITKGVPRPPAAIIDIPIGEYIVGGRVRSCVCPEKIDKSRQLTKRFREAKRAITEYRVLQEQNGAALVEIKPRTGVKHQIRCHMSFGLNTPLLGDHKYSRVDRIAPQKLNSSILACLHLRQQKARSLPMHLHAKSIVIPGAKANGESLFIKAPLPSYFLDNMKSLKLSNNSNQ